MFQLDGLVSHPLCHRAGTPAARHIVMNSIPCTPQSPLSDASAFVEKLGMTPYSSSAQYRMFAPIQWKIFRASHERVRLVPDDLLHLRPQLRRERDVRQPLRQVLLRPGPIRR